MRIPSSLGLATGFLAAVVSIPFVSKGCNSTKPVESNVKLDKEAEDFDLIQALLTKGNDERLREIRYAEKVYPDIRRGLISLYKAEKEDIEALLAGKITEKDRKVKIFISDALQAGEEGEDMDVGPTIHIIKYFDIKQPDGSFRRIYVNEAWPINPKTGGILPTERLRVRMQASKDINALYEKGAHKLFITDMFQLIWHRNDDNSKPGATIYASMARQPFYREWNGEGNPINQTELLVSNPTSCISCHVISPKNNHTKHIHSHSLSKRTNYGAITQDHYFDAEYSNHPGYKKQMISLDDMVKKGEISKEQRDQIAKAMRNSTIWENPFMVETLQELSSNKNIPWLNGDVEAVGRDPGRKGFTYRDNEGKIMEKAIYPRFRPLGIGEWWSRDDLEVTSR